MRVHLLPYGLRSIPSCLALSLVASLLSCAPGTGIDGDLDKWLAADTDTDTDADTDTDTDADTDTGTGDTATVANLPPVAADDALTVAEGDQDSVDVLANDTDADGLLRPLTVVVVDAPVEGTAVPNPDGSIRYTHGGSETTSDSFTYTVSDDDGAASNVATVAVTVTPANDPPITVDDAAQVDEAGAVAVDVLTNDSDPDDSIDVATVAISSAPQHGTAVPEVDGTVTYTHDGSATSADSFAYTVDDASGATSAPATVAVTILPIADPPVAVPDTGVVDEGAAATIDVAANDSDPDGDLDVSSVGIVVLPAFGTALPNPDGTVTYTHDGSETTADSFQYDIADLTTTRSNVVTVTVSITPVNDPPVAGDDTASVASGDFVDIDLVANDTDADDTLDLASITPVTMPTAGTLAPQGPGVVRYTHDGSPGAADGFQYTIEDSLGAVSNTATVSITISAGNIPPVAANDAGLVLEGGSTTIDLLANDSGVDDALDFASIVVVTPAMQAAALVDNGDGTFTYTHDGSETPHIDGFQYTVDDVGGATSNTATVRVDVLPVNDPPVAVDDATTVARGGAVLIDLLGNDTDADDGLDPATIVLTVPPFNAAGLVDHGNGTVTYTHNGSAGALDGFQYTVDDLAGETSNPANVRIDITP